MGRPSSDNAKRYKISQTSFEAMDLKNSFMMLTNAYLFFFYGLDCSLLSGFLPSTLRYQLGVVCVLLSRELTFVFISLPCQRDYHQRAYGNNVNDSSSKENEDDAKDEEDDDDDSWEETTTTTMPHPRRPLGKAARAQDRVNSFWKSWSREYLTTLHPRAKWRKTRRDAAVDDLVLLVDESAPRGEWRLGRIVQVGGTDSHVRKALVKRADGKVVLRDRTKLVLLEVEDGEAVVGQREAL